MLQYLWQMKLGHGFTQVCVSHRPLLTQKAPFDFKPWWLAKQWSLRILLFSEIYELTSSFRHVTQIYAHNKLRGTHNRSSKRYSCIVLLL